MKTCRVCKILRPETSFEWAQAPNRPRKYRIGKCSKCRYQDKKAYLQEYWQTPEAKLSHIIKQKRYSEKYPEKIKAHQIA